LDIVLDSNVLFRILISGGDIISLFFDNKLKIYAPLRLKEEFLRHKKEIVAKSGFTSKEFEVLSESLFNRIILVPLKEYAPFLIKAKIMLAEHEKDEDFVALCLYKGIMIWTYEDRIFKIGLGISTKKISKSIT
jgi:predicted nucleic acid-binding protein